MSEMTSFIILREYVVVSGRGGWCRRTMGDWVVHWHLAVAHGRGRPRVGRNGNREGIMGLEDRRLGLGRFGLPV